MVRCVPGLDISLLQGVYRSYRHVWIQRQPVTSVQSTYLYHYIFIFYTADPPLQRDTS